MSRLRHIDWLRGVAVIAMIEWHALESWTLPGADRQGTAWFIIGTIGGFAAPLFLFLAGVAHPARRRQQNGSRPRSARGGLVSAEAGLGGLWPGASLPAPGLSAQPERELEWTAQARHLEHPRPVHGRVRLLLRSCEHDAAHPDLGAPSRYRIRAAHAFHPGRVVADAASSPPRGVLPAGWQLRHLQPLPVDRPRLCRRRRRRLDGQRPAAIDTARWQWRFAAASGVTLASGLIGQYLPAPFGHSAFWTTSLSFFLIRVGGMMLALGLAWLWLQRPTAARWSPLLVFGRTSLFVYWVHVEIAYGVFTYPIQRSLPLQWSIPAFALFTGLMLRAAMLWERRRAPVADDSGAYEGTASVRASTFSKARGPTPALGPAPDTGAGCLCCNFVTARRALRAALSAQGAGGPAPLEKLAARLTRPSTSQEIRRSSVPVVVSGTA